MHVTDLPVSFAELTNLREITFRNTYTTVFPQALAQIPSLEVLILAGGTIRDVPDNIASNSLINFQITGHQLERFPPFLLNQGNIEIIGLGDNRIMEIPDAISDLEALFRLGLARNSIRQLPESIAEIRLTDLYMDGNPLESLPEAYNRRRNLCFLSISDIDTLDLDRRTAGKFDNCREHIQNTSAVSIVNSSVFTNTVLIPVFLTTMFVVFCWVVVTSMVISHEKHRRQES